MPLYGAVEIGGTKADVAFGSSADTLSQPVRVETTTPDRTLGEIASILKSRPTEAVGVACFGPIDRRSGSILSTPKAGWSNIQVRSILQEQAASPVHLDLDVIGSALGEGRWGAAAGSSAFAYVTVGTGIGAGIVIAGEPIAPERHPEAGHIGVERHPEDPFPGTCPFHGDCLEGMASGPALEGRFGTPASWSSEVVDLATFYIAQGLRALIYVAAVDRVVVGGGVSKAPGFHSRLREQTGTAIADYPRPFDAESVILEPGLGELSGLAGALVLAAGSSV